MKKSKLICSALLTCSLAFSVARVEASVFEEANRAFADGRFDDAVKQYETVGREKGYSAPVLYNLANSYFRAGQIGPAILNYERAQVLAPNDPDIAANLSFARKQAGLFVQADSIAEAARIFSMNEWAWLGCATLLLTCALIVAGRVYPAQRLYLRLGTGIAIVILVAAGIAITTQFDALQRAVVIAKEAPVRISPFESARSAFVLSPGEEVTLGKSHENFVFVQDRQHRSGWVSQGQIEAVVPSMKHS